MEEKLEIMDSQEVEISDVEELPARPKKIIRRASATTRTVSKKVTKISASATAKRDRYSNAGMHDFPNDYNENSREQDIPTIISDSIEDIDIDKYLELGEEDKNNYIKNPLELENKKSDSEEHEELEDEDDDYFSDEEITRNKKSSSKNKNNRTLAENKDLGEGQFSAAQNDDFTHNEIKGFIRDQYDSEFADPNNKKFTPRQVIVKKRGRRPIHNWEAASRDFIQGVQKSEDSDPDELRYPTLKEIGEIYDIPYQTVRDKSMKERWKEKKENFMLKNAASFHRSRAKRMKKRAEDFDDFGLKTADTGMKLVMQRLIEVAEESNARKSIRKIAIQKLENGITVDPKELRSGIYYRELNELASALERFHNIGQRALGIDKSTLELIGSFEHTELSETTQRLDITQELIRDDPDRLGGLLASLGDADLLPKEIIELIFEENDPVVEDKGVEDAVIVEDGEKK